MRAGLLAAVVLAILPCALASPVPVHDPVLDAVDAEIDRAMKALGESDPAPYFIGVEVTDVWAVRIVGEAGGVHGHNPVRRRWLDVDLRIGNRSLDSSHPLRSGDDSDRGGTMVGLTGDPALLRHALWLEINQRYDRARQRWARVEAENKVLVEEEPAEDLVEVEPARFLGPLQEPKLDPRPWENAVKTASRIFAEYPFVVEGTSTLNAQVETRWFVSSEGARIRHGESRWRIDLDVQTVADDGERLRLYRSFDSHDASGLPDRDVVAAAARRLVEDLGNLRDAPLEEPYSGPAILSDTAAAVFFHEILGHRVEGHRLKQVDNAQTFRNRVGEKILPTFLSVYDDPTQARAAETDLRGHYRFDNEGVAARHVVVVDRGILRGFLQSRSPHARGAQATGHGRRTSGLDPVSRQGNLIVTATESVDNDELRRELIEIARRQDKPYALYIDEIQGGFTFTSRTIPNAFNVSATRAYRVWVDGRPDELVRGIDLIGTPLEAFAKITRAGRVERVFNGNCGAESGWVPVSAVAPALLLESVETQRKRKDQETPPLLPPPLAEREVE